MWNEIRGFRLLTQILILVCIPFNLIAQTEIKLPGVYIQLLKIYPLSSDQISFSTPYPFSDFKDQKPDPAHTCQFLMNLPLVSDSLLSECIKYTMFSFSLDRAYKNLSRGTEIWYGTISNGLNLDPAMIGIYFKHHSDSTKVYILTTFSLQIMEKKRKTNTSQYIGESIKSILEKHWSKK